VAETLDYTVDCAVGVDVVVGPGGDDLSYCVADNYFCDLAGGVIQVATEAVLVYCLVEQR
jgi:hypothetical protein